jgi:hypothetical protein
VVAPDNISHALQKRGVADAISFTPFGEIKKILAVLVGGTVDLKRVEADIHQMNLGYDLRRQQLNQDHEERMLKLVQHQASVMLIFENEQHRLCSAHYDREHFLQFMKDVHTIYLDSEHSDIDQAAYIQMMKTFIDALKGVREDERLDLEKLQDNAAITDWFVLSADIQAVDPARFDARSAFLFGLHAKIVF